jgi:phosphohistidine phosphatase
MKRELLLMRHGQAAGAYEAGSDFERVLTPKGEADARQAGAWLQSQGLVPDVIVASTAQRAEQTARQVCQALSLDEARLHWAPRLYDASLQDILTVIESLPDDAGSALLVGHNPGFEETLNYLVHGPGHHDMALAMSAASMARLQLELRWSELGPGVCRLVDMRHP